MYKNKLVYSLACKNIASIFNSATLVFIGILFAAVSVFDKITALLFFLIGLIAAIVIDWLSQDILLVK